MGERTELSKWAERWAGRCTLEGCSWPAAQITLIGAPPLMIEDLKDLEIEVLDLDHCTAKILLRVGGGPGCIAMSSRSAAELWPQLRDQLPVTWMGSNEGDNG